MKLLKLRFKNVERILPVCDWLAQKPLWTIMLVGLLSFGGSWSVSLKQGLPSFNYHDEFSYLLCADTFLHGRVCNLSPVDFEPLETFDELMVPGHISKYPPGQGLFLALGKKIFGHPVFGVWLSVALMCMAVCWMLYGWLPRRWALIGGLVNVIQFGIFSYWSQGYGGGAVAAMGGALFFGSIPRVLKDQRIIDLVCFCLGLALLVFSGPCEDILWISILAFLALSRKISWHNIDVSLIVRRSAVPVSIGVMAIIILAGTYNSRLTGNPFRSPATLYEQQFSSVPRFIWESLKPSIGLNNPQMAQDDQENIKYYLDKRSLKGFFRALHQDLIKVLSFYFWSLIGVTSLVMAVVLYIRGRGAVYAEAGAFMVCVMLSCHAYPAEALQYAFLAPVAVLVMTTGLMIISRLRLRSYHIGVVIVLIVLVGSIAMGCINLRGKKLFGSMGRETTHLLNRNFMMTREQLQFLLNNEPGKSLVIVTYLPGHHSRWEWVYNEADLENAKIIWARDLGPQRNAKLIAHYKDRQLCQILVSDNNTDPPSDRFDPQS